MLEARHVPIRGGRPRGKMINRPSVEYTGNGNQLIYDGWGGRIFRSSEEKVKEGCDLLCEQNADDYCNYNDLYANWEIMQSDFGAKFGWTPSDNEDYGRKIEFTFTWCDEGSELYDKFGERVLCVEPIWDCMPYESYFEL